VVLLKLFFLLAPVVRQNAVIAGGGGAVRAGALGAQQWEARMSSSSTEAGAITGPAATADRPAHYVLCS